ncbi:MAG: hypothetical protein GVY19_05480 [Bacteroidetes bacterium]|jgi:hypothetical protein|nr:hypothetical protein [Bacteroidota bacterium]
MERDEWTKIYSTNKLYLAKMAQDLLKAEEIEAVLVDKQDSFYHFGDIEIYVQPENTIRAKFVIKDLEL